MRAAPAVSCAKIVQRNAHEHTGSAEAIRHSLRNGFTAYGALSPATNSSCHRHRRIGGFSRPGWADPNLRRFATSNGCQNPTFLPYAATRLRQKAWPGFGAVRPARCRPLTENRPANNLRADAAASTASPPAFVTIAIRPSCRERTGRTGSADLPDRLSGILPVGLFCRSLGASGWAKARLRRAQTGRPPFPRLLPDRTCRRDVKLDTIDPIETSSLITV